MSGSIAQAVSQKPCDQCFIICNVVIKAEQDFLLHWKAEEKIVQQQATQLTDFFYTVFSCFKALCCMFVMGLEGSSIFFSPAIILMKGKYEDFTSFNKIMTEIAALHALCTVLSNFHEVTI